MEKDVEERLVQVCRGLIEMLELIFVSFRTRKVESMDEVEKVKEEIRRRNTEFKDFLILKSSPDQRGREWAKPFLSMASIFDRMGHHMEGLLERLKSMAIGQIFFSDSAVKEVNDVFQEAMDLLESLPDLILSRDKQHAQHIGEQVRSILKIANGYSEEHEERLIQGVCMPKSSPAYLGLLESLKGIIGHILEVSGKIVSLSPKS